MYQERSHYHVGNLIFGHEAHSFGGSRDEYHTREAVRTFFPYFFVASSRRCVRMVWLSKAAGSAYLSAIQDINHKQKSIVHATTQRRDENLKQLPIR
jgi:hypothetical protein